MFSERLKNLRKKAGLTQQELAEQLNLAVRSYQRYEAVNGFCDPPISTLVKLADILDVSIDYLLGRDEWIESHEEPSDGHQ